MNATPTAFLEIEHKFVVDAGLTVKRCLQHAVRWNQSVRRL